MGEVTVDAVGAGVFGFGGGNGGGDVGVKRNPAVDDVGEVVFAVFAFGFVAKLNGAPKTFDVAEHFRAQAPHAGHPVAVEAPDAVATDEAFKFVAGDVDPVGIVVFGKANGPGERGVDKQFDDANKEKQGHCQGGPVDTENIAPWAHGAVKAFNNARATEFFAVGKFMQAAPCRKHGDLRRGANDEPAHKAGNANAMAKAHGKGGPKGGDGEQEDKPVKPRCTAKGGREFFTCGAQAGNEVKAGDKKAQGDDDAEVGVENVHVLWARKGFGAS